MNKKLKYILYLIPASILETLKIFFFIILFPSMYLNKFSSWGFAISEKYQLRYFSEMDKLDFSLERDKPKIPEEPETKMKKSSNWDIMGKTKTGFLEEIPAEEPEPILSEDLEPEDPVYEEPDIDPDDVDYVIDQVFVEKLLADDEDLFDYHEGDYVSGEFSTGVTIEQLSETYYSLSKEEIPGEEARKVASVLNVIEGTDFFRFFAMNEMFAEKARMLLENETQNGLPEHRRGGFDFSRYID